LAEITPFPHDRQAAASKPAILQIVPSLDAGGAEQGTLDVAKAIAGAGFRALVVSEGGRMENELQRLGAELIRLPAASKNPATILANIGKLEKIIRERNVALVHARSRAPAWSAYYAARRTGIPFVTTYHGIYNAKSRFKRFYNSIMTRGDIVIANSQWTAAHIRDTYEKQPRVIAVIARGLDLDLFSPERVTKERITWMRNEWQVAPGQRVVLLPGRLTRWKGQLVFIKALAELKRENRLGPVRAVLAGDEQGRVDYVEEIRKAIADGDLKSEVLIAHHVVDMPAAYGAADLVVSASTDPEAFGRVAAEGSAMGKPVIATDHGGARETVRSGETGVLIPPGDVHALAEALGHLLAAPADVLAQMGEAGRAHIAARFTVARMCAHTLDVYRKLLGSKFPE